MQISGGKQVSRGSKMKKKKKKKATNMLTPTCLLPIKCTPREGARGGTDAWVLKTYLHSLFVRSCTQQRSTTQFILDPSLLWCQPQRRRREEKGREGGKKPSWNGGSRRRDPEGEKEGGCPWRARSSHLNLSLALTGTYCGAAVHGGTYLLQIMSYCLPTWPRGFPCLHTGPGQP